MGSWHRCLDRIGSTPGVQGLFGRCDQVLSPTTPAQRLCADPSTLRSHVPLPVQAVYGLVEAKGYGRGGDSSARRLNENDICNNVELIFKNYDCARRFCPSPTNANRGLCEPTQQHGALQGIILNLTGPDSSPEEFESAFFLRPFVNGAPQQFP
jgi:hypothetical protein